MLRTSCTTQANTVQTSPGYKGACELSLEMNGQSDKVNMMFYANLDAKDVMASFKQEAEAPAEAPATQAEATKRDREHVLEALQFDFQRFGCHRGICLPIERSRSDSLQGFFRFTLGFNCWCALCCGICCG